MVGVVGGDMARVGVPKGMFKKSKLRTFSPAR